MAHIAVVGKPSRLRFQVTTQINLQSGTHATIHTSMKEIESQIADGFITVVCMVEDQLTDQHFEAIDEFNSRYTQSKLVFVSKGLNEDTREQFRAMKLERCTLIDANYEISDLHPVTKKMSLGRPVFVRKFFRHRTNQVCSMNAANSKKNTSVRVQDISQGGLMAAFRDINLQIGEVVHILVATKDGKKQHRVVGKVAWLNSSRKQFGVEFDNVSLETATMKFHKLG
jgi:Tfp pilus assembly protein PilZ